MKKGIILLSFIFFSFFASAINIDFSCPEIVQTEFSCQITATNLTGTYDLKLDFMQDNKRISKIYGESVWKSTNYYINNFISDSNEKEIKIQVNTTSPDTILGTLKLRKTGKTTVEYQKNFSVLPDFENSQKTKQNEPQTPIQKKDLTNLSLTITKNTEENSQIVSSSPIGENIINLNPVQQERIIYKSKDEKIAKFAIYAFCIFLILIIIILLLRL